MNEHDLTRDVYADKGIDPDDDRLIDAREFNAPSQEIRPKMSLSRQWNLIANFSGRDLKAKFNGTLLGWVWSLVVPLSTLLIYSLVFSVVFRMKPPALGNGEEGIFAIWLFAGLIMWSFFSSSINGGMNALTSSGGLLSKIYFPAYAPVLGSGLAVGVQSLIEVGILLGAFIVVANIGWTWLLAPFVLALFVVFSQALAVTLSILNVFARDLAHLVNVALQLLFYMTPIIYSPDFLPETWNGIPLRAIIEFSPLAEFVTLFRNTVYDLTCGTWQQWLSVFLWTLASYALAAWIVKKHDGDLAEQI
ncbi:ABC-2 type transporter [Arcanobacterium haemolyticum]|uniref:ABC transporter permease n=1 Tax=Arcanobacterium haemolyticum TaxID=28264 RepID=UPI000D9D5521|nr:ABC transporter permease [Arcanobacterium haemolyticum]SPT75721.1 ABC-2 type transporter [Arcanobacterium haemolyticum]